MSVNNNGNTNDPENEHFPPEKKVFDIGGAGGDKTETRLPEDISASDNNFPKESKSDLDINGGSDKNVEEKDDDERSKVKSTSVENIDVDDAGIASSDRSVGNKSESLRSQPEIETTSDLSSKDEKDSDQKETEDSKQDSTDSGQTQRVDEPIEIDQPTGDGGNTDDAEKDETQQCDNEQYFIDFKSGDFDTDSDLDKWESDSSGEEQASKDMGAFKSKDKKGNSEGAASKKQKCQGSSSEDDSDRPWRSSGAGTGSGNGSRRQVQAKITSYHSPGKAKKDKPGRSVLPSQKQRGGLSHLKKQWSDKDTLQYRMGYPGKKDTRERLNQYFYQGKIPSKPDGCYIDDFHKDWWENYDRLESHHGFIQWLFPIRETGMNWHAQELQLHEAKAIREDKQAFDRFVKSYQMMLNFYGIRLVNRRTGKVTRADNWKPRFRHLNYSMHNYLRITRILKCLGEMGLEHYKYPFLSFMLHEAIVTCELDRTLDSCYNYWIGTVKDDTTREKLRTKADRLYRGEEVDDDEGEEEHSNDEELERGQTGRTGKEKRKLRGMQRDEEDEDIDVD